MKENVHDLDGMIFQDADRYSMWTKIENQLKIWAPKKALDVCCGFGKFSEIFPEYLGIDFSPSMLQLAREFYPTKTFKEADARRFMTDEKFDLIFEANSLHSLGMKPEEFYDLYQQFLAPGGTIACLEKDEFRIFHNYDR